MTRIVSFAMIVKKSSGTMEKCSVTGRCDAPSRQIPCEGLFRVQESGQSRSRVNTMPHRIVPAPFPPSTNELEQIRFALDQSAILAITNVAGQIRYANEKFCEISKYSREELLGQDHRILNSGYHPKEYIRDLWRTIAHGRIWHGELRNRAKDGTIYWVDTTIVPFLDHGGKPWQYMAIRYDITERKRQQQRLLDQAGLLSVGEMAAVVAHEVRNPLAGIRSGMQLLSSLLPEAAEGREIIGDIISRVDSLNSVLGDLLQFARLRPIRSVDIDASSFASDLSRSLKLDPSMTRVEIETQVAPDANFEADLDQLRLVFTNLILNAGQAMDHGGRIVIGSRMIDGDQIELSVRS